MTSELLAELERRFGEIDQRLTNAATPAGASDREATGRSIVALFRETEAAQEQLAAFKERIRGLVERFKALQAEGARANVAARGMAPAPPRSDHLGSSTYIERGWSAIAAGDPERAVKELGRALELAPNDPKAEGLLGWAQMLLERYDDALYTYSKVLMKEPSDPLARVNLGYISLKKGIFGEAIEHLARVIREDQDRKATLYANLYLGLVYLEREMYSDARGFLRKALELGPNLIEAHWEIGRSLYLEGNLRGAEAAWTDGVRANRHNPWGQRCGEALAMLQAGKPVPLDGSEAHP